MQKEAQLKDSWQSTMFDLLGASVPAPLAEIQLLDAPEPTDREKIGWERELLGVSLGPRILDPQYAPEGAILTKERLESFSDGERILIAGEVASVRVTADRQGRRICFAGLEIFDGSLIDIAIWSKAYEKTAHLWYEGSLLKLN